MSSGTRVLLVKPGDVLMIGNVGEVSHPSQVEPIIECLAGLGITAMVFSADIDVETVTP